MWEDMKHKTIRVNIFMLVLKWKPKVTSFLHKKDDLLSVFIIAAHNDGTAARSISPHHGEDIHLISSSEIVRIFAVPCHVGKITFTFLQLRIYAPLLRIDF